MEAYFVVRNLVFSLSMNGGRSSVSNFLCQHVELSLSTSVSNFPRRTFNAWLKSVRLNKIIEFWIRGHHTDIVHQKIWLSGADVGYEPLSQEPTKCNKVNLGYIGSFGTEILIRCIRNPIYKTIFQWKLTNWAETLCARYSKSEIFVSIILALVPGYTGIISTFWLG